jgi:hypothetical protein
MMNLPNFRTYGNYTSSNYGAHCLQFNVPGIGTIWFSYKTPVAFQTNSTFACRVNDWGPTTGKHLNCIEPDKSKRIPGDQFERILSEAFSK